MALGHSPRKSHQVKLSQSAKDKLYHLQRKYGPGNSAPWVQVATEELYLSKTYIRVKSYREQFADVLGLHQLVKTQKQPWFVNLEKLAAYLDRRENQYR